MIKDIITKLKLHNNYILSSILILLGGLYLYLATFPKHNDYMSILSWSETFALHPLHYLDVLSFTYGNTVMTLVHPPAFTVIQGTWIIIGSYIFNYNISMLTIFAHPNVIQLWGLIPTLTLLFLFAIISYLSLKNKWLSLICFGSLSFISIEVMGQEDIWYAFFIFLSMIFLIKSFESDKRILYMSLALLFLGVSLTFKTFGGLLYPIYIIFIFYNLINNKYKLLKCLLLLILFTGIFAIAALAIWIPYSKWFIPINMSGESNFLLNLQISPIGALGVHTIAIWLFGYIIILYFALHNSYKNMNKSIVYKKYFIFYIFATIAWFFITVYTYPQWWVLLLPSLLLVLDTFESKFNYLLALGLLSLYIYYPMMFINNVDNILIYYLPIIPVSGQLSIILTTTMFALLVIWTFNIKSEIIDNSCNDKFDSGLTSIKYLYDKVHIDKIAPVVITFLPYIICIIIGYTAILVIGYGVAGGDTISQPVGEIYGNITAGQTFISEYNYLNAVDIDLATYSHTPTNNVTFHLKSTPDSEDIATVTVEGSKISDNAFYNFKFPLIKDSKGKQYYFSIESPNATEDNAVTIWSSNTDVYSKGTAYYNNQYINGDLVFKTHYNPSLSDIFSFIGNKYPEISMG